MPRKTKSFAGPLSAVSTVRNFVDVMKEMSFDDERAQAEKLPRLLVLAEDVETGQRIGSVLTGLDRSPAITAVRLDAARNDIDQYDVVIVYDPASGKSFADVRRMSAQSGVHVFDLADYSDHDGEWASAVRSRIAGQLPGLAPALGRWFKPFRPAATKAVIDETARVNAQFALVSNLPAVIPIFGSLASAGADFFVLTKNQLMMIFKLAAINGRDLRDQWSLMREMLPVVGAGLALRTVAREASSFLPFAAGTIPKMAIAYSGTMAAGWAADFYYQVGQKPTKEQWNLYYKQAGTALKRFDRTAFSGFPKMPFSGPKKEVSEPGSDPAA